MHMKNPLFQVMWLKNTVIAGKTRRKKFFGRNMIKKSELYHFIKFLA